MADFWPATTLAIRPADASRIVARRTDGNLATHADLLARCGAWYTLFAEQAETDWGLYLNDPFEFAAALFAAWHAGKTVVLPADDLPATVAGLHRSGCAVAGNLPQALLPLDGQTGSSPALAALDPERTQLKVFTSGSQGQPQAIHKALRQLQAEVATLESTFGARLGDGAATIWTTVSHQHIYGLLFYILWPLCSGRPFATQRLLYPQDLAARLGPEPAVLVTTPANLKRLGGELLDWGQARLGLRAAFSSGGPLPFDAARSAAMALGQTPIEVFGSSETGGIAWRQCQTESQGWQVFADVQWREVDGCLAVQSPNLPDAHWRQTTDRIQPRVDGSFSLLGRTDRIVKIEEKRISLDAIEHGLLATGLVQEARALVLATAIGERVAVVAVPSAAGQALLQRGRKQLADGLKQALAGAIEPVALPRRWRFVAQMPHNAQGKTPQALLASLFGVGDAMPPVLWLLRGATQARATLRVDAELPLFRGHFDAAAILPGVAQLDWAITLAGECFMLPPHFERLEALKFMRPISPGTDLLLELHWKAAGTVSFAWTSLGSAEEQVSHSNGRAVWSDVEISHA